MHLPSSAHHCAQARLRVAPSDSSGCTVVERSADTRPSRRRGGLAARYVPARRRGLASRTPHRARAVRRGRARIGLRALEQAQKDSTRGRRARRRRARRHELARALPEVRAHRRHLRALVTPARNATEAAAAAQSSRRDSRRPSLAEDVVRTRRNSLHHSGGGGGRGRRRPPAPSRASTQLPESLQPLLPALFHGRNAALDADVPTLARRRPLASAIPRGPRSSARVLALDVGRLLVRGGHVALRQRGRPSSSRPPRTSPALIELRTWPAHGCVLVSAVNAYRAMHMSDDSEAGFSRPFRRP